MLEIPKNLTQQDLVKYLNVLMALLKKLQDGSKKDLDAVKGSIDKVKAELETSIKTIELKKGDKGDRGEDGVDGKDGLNGERGSDGKDGKDGKDGRDGYTPIAGVDYDIPMDGKDGEDGKDGNTITPEEIRDKLEELEGDERLPIDAIKDLRKELDKMKTDKSLWVSGQSGSGGRIVKAYDISDQLNGVLKVFKMPSAWRVISVHLSSVPNILRDTTDYVYDASGNTLTFTSEIQASTSLLTGQTCVITYSE